MAEIDVAPVVQKNLKLTIGTDSYSAHVSSVAWKPTSDIKKWHGGTPEASFTDTSASEWTANLTLIQDWETEDSLCNYLLANEGVQAIAVYKPRADGDSTFTATITLVAPDIGGAVNEFNESTVQMGSTKPVRTTA